MTSPRPADIPARTRYAGVLSRSERWAAFHSRPGDVIVTTPAKCGTTWTQGILAMLFTGDPGVDANPSGNGPWLDNRMKNLEDVLDIFERQTGRRQIKSHTPLDGLPIWNDVFYITVYRHPIDQHFSARKHVANYLPVSKEAMGFDPALFPDDPRESFRIFVDGDEQDHGSVTSIVNHYRQTRNLEPRDNLLRLHYLDMTRDLARAVAAIAALVDTPHPPEVMDAIVEASTFGSMKANAERFGLARDGGFWRNDSAFFDSGTSNKWAGVLTDDDIAAYNKRMATLLPPEEQRWLEHGDG